MKRQRGFALLLVFVMAAAIAITLYNELPRVAFEAQRNKEQLLIDRGEQYQRAIQLYVRKMKTYPSSIEQLEKTNQIRFLRKRYADPMTGKSEWRAIHINAGGVYTDSLTHKPPAAKGEEKSVNTFTYEAPTVGSTAPTGPADPGFPQARPSERAGMPPMPGQAPPPPADPANPNAQPQPGASPYPVIPTGVVLPPGTYTGTWSWRESSAAGPAHPTGPTAPGPIPERIARANRRRSAGSAFPAAGRERYPSAGPAFSPTGRGGSGSAAGTEPGFGNDQQHAHESAAEHASRASTNGNAARRRHRGLRQHRRANRH